MDLELTGKIALVTGGTRGIGRAIAAALAAEGARVAVCARGALAEHAPPGGVAVVADVTTATGAAHCVDQTVALLGGLDLVICNVGGSGARHFDAVDEADLSRALDVNLWSAYRVAKHAVGALRRRGGGVITLISSIWGREAGGAPAYNIAKAGEISLAKAMARDLAKDGIRVNSVAPGSILFPGGGWERRQAADPAGIAAFVERELPWGRFGAPEEVAAVVAFLCSPRAGWVSGACISVDGAQGRAF